MEFLDGLELRLPESKYRPDGSALCKRHDGWLNGRWYSLSDRGVKRARPAANEPDLRAVVNATPQSGLCWDFNGGALPKDFPPVLDGAGILSIPWAQRRHSGSDINHALAMVSRERDGPRSQPLRRGDRQPEREDHGKRRPPAAMMPARRSREGSATSSPTHEGNLVGLQIHPAHIQDRDGAVAELVTIRKDSSRGCGMSSPMAAMREASSALGSPDGAVDRGDHQTLRHRQRLRGPSAPMGGRTNLRRAQSLPQTGQGLRGQHRKRRRMDLHRPHSAPHASSRKSLKPLAPF